MKGADPYEERDEHEGKHEGNTRGTREKSLNQQDVVTHMLDP